SQEDGKEVKSKNSTHKNSKGCSKMVDQEELIPPLKKLVWVRRMHPNRGGRMIQMKNLMLLMKNNNNKLMLNIFKLMKYWHRASSFMSTALAKVAMDKVFSFDKVDSSSSSSSSDAVTKPAVSKEVVKVKVTNRCFDSNKKVGVMVFKCRCGETFLGCIDTGEAMKVR
nr:zinc finger A20 and AN1 domain-containing stress-associated protein 1-like [Tanacetum cinerariifolium]